MLGKIEDPVCGMEIHVETAPAKTYYEGEVYYFCSQGCKQEFEKNPEAFIRKNEDEL